MDEILKTVETLLLGAVPTALLFILLVLAYQFLIQGPLTRTLAERRARTEGAVEEAHRAVALAEQKAADYAARLRQARAEIFKLREQRVREWGQERDAAVESVRKSAASRVAQARTEIEAETGRARQAIQASAPELARRVVTAVLPVTAGGSR